jgi:hypothetical protein
MKLRLAVCGLLSAAVFTPAPVMASGLLLLTDVALTVPGNPAFGGLSAIEMGPGGRSAVVVSDRGTLFEVALTREAGRVTSMGLTGAATLTDAAGLAAARPEQMDAEGLARLPDGRLAISFEGNMRIAIHGRDGRERQRIAPPPGSGALPGNGAYEGLAADRHGNLYTLAEQAPGRGPTPLHRYANGRWEHFGSIPRVVAYHPVGLDFDDRGRLYVLERRFTLGGFSSRITRYTVTADGLRQRELLLETQVGLHGNLEGLSLWRNADGTLIASAVADNNFRQPTATRLVEYAVPD